MALGLTDAFRLFAQPEQSYSWWDYRMGAFRRNFIAHRPPAAVAAVGTCTAAYIDKGPRKLERAGPRPVVRRPGMSASCSRLRRAPHPLPALAELPRTGRQHSPRTHHVPAGTTALFDERQACQGFPFVLAGSIRVVKAAPSGCELPLYRVALARPASSRRLSARADALQRPRPSPTPPAAGAAGADFQALLAEAPFRDFVFQLFSERIADLMQLIEEVAFRKLDQRLAALLLGKGQRVHTTQQLADELGSVREIVSRLLKNFAAQGTGQAVARADRNSRPGRTAPALRRLTPRCVTKVTDGRPVNKC